LLKDLNVAGRPNFIHFLSMAKGSAREVESQLYVAFDLAYIDETQFDSLKSLAGSTKRLIAGLMQYLRQSGIKGEKYR
jgi:four helix bundle protein